MNTGDTNTTTGARSAPTDGPMPSRRRPGQTLACGWCGSPILIPPRGRVPKWCSSSCRHRAWELTRAAASGRAAVEVVDRIVEVDRPVDVVQKVPVNAVPKGSAWPATLVQLVTQVDSGRVYDRDLPALAQALQDVIAALERRPGWGRQPR